jgi:hypothetical protein
VEKVHCSISKTYNYCGSCLITALLLPTHVFEEAIIETSKIHNLFNIQIIYILVCWNPLENGDKIHNLFFILIIISSISN